MTEWAARESPAGLSVRPDVDAAASLTMMTKCQS